MSHQLEEHKHADPSRAHRVQRTLDHLLEVMTADLIVNLGVFITGIVLMAVELGWYTPGGHEKPQQVVVVRKDSTPAE